jgi:hypothetical protein
MRAFPVLLLAGGLALTDPVARAAPPIPGAQSFATGNGELMPGLLQVDSRHIELAPVSVTELAAGERQALASPPRLVTRRSDGLEYQGGIDPAPLNLTVTRELRDLWRYAPRSGLDAMPQMRVSLRGSDGLTGYLSSNGKSGSKLPVDIRVTQQLRTGARGERWYEGSVVLQIPLDQITEAGTYSGRIELNQESL